MPHCVLAYVNLQIRIQHILILVDFESNKFLIVKLAFKLVYITDRPLAGPNVKRPIFQQELSSGQLDDV